MALIYGVTSSLNPGGDGLWGNPDDGDTTIRIYSYDTVTGAVTLVFDTGIAVSDPNYGNAIALDAVANTLYFVDTSNTLRFLDLSAATLSLGTVALTGALGGGDATTVSIGAQPATGYADTALQFDNATFFANSYWYIQSETNQLKRAAIDASTHTITSITTFNLVDGSGNPVSNAANLFKFGDLASDGQGNIYGWTVPTGGVSTFFKVDVNGAGTTPAEILPDNSNLTLEVINNQNNFSMQLTFVGSVLYGHRTGLNQWFTVDTATGALTDAVAPSIGAPGMRDIAGPQLTTRIAPPQDPPSDPVPSELGDYVWNDYNRNGIQDSTESGVGGVAVALYDAEGKKIRETSTDSQGAYRFKDLTAGNYSVGFTAPSGFSFTAKNQGSDPGKDSDADSITGRTTTITLPEGTTDLAWDAGLFRDYTATGLTPGYWKNHTEQWDGGLSAGSTTYEGTMFSQWGTYGVTGLTKEVVTGAIKWQEPSKGKTSPVLEDMSLAKALDFGGGDGGGTYNPYGALARHSSAALLNASEDDLFGAGSANPAKGYRFNPDRVRQLTSMALTSDAIVRGVITAPLSPVNITLTEYEVQGSGVAAGTYAGLDAVVNLHKVFAFNNQLGG